MSETSSGAQSTGAPSSGAPAAKPGLLQAVGILALISGILHLIGCVGLVIGLSIAGLGSFGIACLFLPLAALPLAMGVVEVRYALALLSEPLRVERLNRTLSIVQVCLVLFGNVVALAAGVVGLVADSDRAVQDYLVAARARR